MQSHELTLYHIGFSRSTCTLWMLEELGMPYKVTLVERDREKRSSDFLKINPLNKVPSLAHNGRVITEAAAICLYLAESFPEKNLEVPKENPKRSDYLKWLFIGPSCIEPAILERMYERKEIPVDSSGWGDLEQLIEFISRELSGNQFILGDQFTAADVVLASQLGWGVMINKLPATPEIRKYLERIEQRPARKRTLDMEERKSWPS